VALFGRSKPTLPIYEAADVFRAGATPTVTLVDRTKSKDYREITFALRQQGRIVNFFGPSKSGKTVLCMEQVLKDKSPVRVHGGKIESTRRFWELLAFELGVAIGHEYEDEDSSSAEVKGKTKVGIPPIGFGVEAKQGVERRSRSKRTFDLSPVLARAVERELVRRRSTLVIDDFHLVKPEVQTEIMNSLRDVLQNGNSVVIVSVPEEAKNVLSHVPDLSLLCTSVSAEIWSVEDIKAIARKGFDALGMKVDQDSLKTLSQFAYRNPMLMQEYCLRLCFELDIAETQKKLAQPNITPTNLRDVFVFVANQRARDYAEFFSSNSGARWPLKAGRRVNIGQLAFLALADVGVMQPITVERLATRMRRLLERGSEPLDLKQVIEAIAVITAEMEARLQNRRPLKYEEKTKTIYVLDPFFKAYLKWGLSPKLLGVYPELTVPAAKS